jgi:hypothetical protein
LRMADTNSTTENSTAEEHIAPVDHVDGGGAAALDADAEGEDEYHGDPWDGVPSILELEWIEENGERKMIWKEVPITLEHVKAYNTALRNGGAYDDEVAHSRQDELLRGIASALVSGDIPVDELREIAKELLNPAERVPGFAHWCA